MCHLRQNKIANAQSFLKQEMDIATREQSSTRVEELVWGTRKLCYDPTRRRGGASGSNGPWASRARQKKRSERKTWEEKKKTESKKLTASLELRSSSMLTATVASESCLEDMMLMGLGGGGSGSGSGSGRSVCRPGEEG